MRKKIIYIILTTILLTITSTVYGFSDTEGHWAEDAVLEFNKANIIKGYENNEFKPDSYITRAEVATIINRMNGATKESSKFIPDITRNDWYYSDIRKAVQMGVMKGDENGYTHPNSYITREEAVVMLARAFYIDDSVIAKNEFKDENEISDWAKKVLNTFTKFEYINGYEDKTIRPKKNITRAELVTIINRMFSKIATTGVYEGNVSGNMIVIGNNVVLNNLTVNGSLFITEGTKKTFTAKNVLVEGNLFLREELDTKEIHCNNEKILLYLENEENHYKYKNDEYGIEISLPNNVEVIEKWNVEKIDYKKKDFVLIDIEKKDEYYLTGIKTIAKEETKKVANIYEYIETGKFNNAEYILYTEIVKNTKNNFLIIKRDNIVYKIMFYNITIENFVDNVIGTLNLFETDSIIDRKNVVYKNSKLNLKFAYREEYVIVDDSYNTGNINSGDAPLKLFIQVNAITDMKEYSFEEIMTLLRNLASEEGELLETERIQVLSRNAVKFKIASDEKLMYSLYIVDDNILYNLIFVANSDDMNEVGKDLFNEIIRSIEI